MTNKEIQPLHTTTYHGWQS